MILRKIRRDALAACFPERCIACGRRAQQGAWCHACHASLPRIENGCKRCATPLPLPTNTLCGVCLRRPPPFDAALAACRYAFPFDHIVQNFKYGRRLSLAAPLGQLLTDVCCRRSDHSVHVFQDAPTHIIAMPLSPKRQIERGFNQAQELAQPVASALKLPLLTHVLTRIKDTPTQAGLPWRERHKNVRNAFACCRDLSGHRILLIDDVMTTGATATAAAKALRKAGAEKIFIAVVARATMA